MSPEGKALSDAKSRIYWGEENNETVQKLVETGLFEKKQAEDLVGVITIKRNKEARTEATIRITKAIVLIVVSRALTFGYFKQNVPYYIGRSLAFVCLVPRIYRLYVFSKGIEMLVRPRFRLLTFKIGEL